MSKRKSIVSRIAAAVKRRPEAKAEKPEKDAPKDEAPLELRSDFSDVCRELDAIAEKMMEAPAPVLPVPKVGPSLKAGHSLRTEKMGMWRKR